MIHTALEFLQGSLNSYLSLKIPEGPENGGSTRVEFPKLDNDPMTLKTGAVNVLLTNLTQETNLMPAEPFVQVSADGIKNKVSPPLSLFLGLLFVSKFSNYLDALSHLSYTLQFFQSNPLFTRDNFPALPAEFDKLNIEFKSLTDAQKNETWSSLRLAYLPSVAYNLKMLVYQTDLPSMSSSIKSIQINQTNNEF